MVDVFEEVEEQLRSARYQTIVRRGWPYLVGAVVLALAVTATVWVMREQGLRAAASASETYQQGLEALNTGDGAAAEKLFAEIAASGPPAYKALALMHQGSLRAGDGKTAEALARFEQAAEVAKDPIVADAARLKAAYIAFDTASLADIEKRLEPLAEAGRPYSALAREALAMKRMASGKTAEARQAFALLAISPDTGQDLQTRANVAMGVIDAGQAGGVAPAVAAAAALPRSAVPPLTPPAPQGAPPAQGAAPSPPAGAQ